MIHCSIELNGTVYFNLRGNVMVILFRDLNYRKKKYLQNKDVVYNRFNCFMVV